MPKTRILTGLASRVRVRIVLWLAMLIIVADTLASDCKDLVLTLYVIIRVLCCRVLKVTNWLTLELVLATRIPPFRNCATDLFPYGPCVAENRCSVVYCVSSTGDWLDCGA